MRSWKKLRFLFMILLILFFPISDTSVHPTFTEKLQITKRHYLETVIKEKSTAISPERSQSLFTDFFQESIQILGDLNNIEDDFRNIFDLISPEAVNEANLGGRNVTIAILDSGINSTPWITPGQLVGNYTTFPNSNTTSDEYGHGTMVASIIARIAPEAHLINIRVTDAVGEAKTEWFQLGLELAQSLNVSIIHASVGTKQWDSLNATIFTELDRQNITTVFAAGNYGISGSSLTAPATFAEPIAVGMAYNRSLIPFSSSVGPRPSGLLGPDIVAPGVNISTYTNDGSEVRGTGTSFAAPIITGAVALLRDARAFPNAPPSLIKAALLETAMLLNGTAPTQQGNGFLNISATYWRLENLQNTPLSDPLFALSPKILSSMFPYFGHGINGITQTYTLTLYSSLANVTLNPTNSSFIYPLQVSVEPTPVNLTLGLNVLNISLRIPQNAAMDLYEGPLKFNFTTGNRTWNKSMTIKVGNHYPGGNVLFYQGYDNDTFISSGPVGGYSQLQLFLAEYYGMAVTGMVPPDIALAIRGSFRTTSQRALTMEDLEGFDILVLADIEWGISDQEITLIQNWVAQGHSLFVLSYPSLPSEGGTELFSNQSAINRLIKRYGIAIDDDPSLLTNTSHLFPRFNMSTLTPTNPLTEEDRVQEVSFDYNGTSLAIDPGLGAHVLATAPDLTNQSFKVPVAAFWQDNQSTGRVLVFGSEIPFDDNSFPLESKSSHRVLAVRTFHWLIEAQQTPIELLLTSNPVVGSSTRIQITVDDSTFSPPRFNGTIIEANGSYIQITFTKSVNVYVGSWKPLAQGFAFLWLNLGPTENAQTSGPFIIEVLDPASSNLLFLMIFGGIALLGLSFYLYSARRTPQGSPLDKKLMALQKQKPGTRKVNLETALICPKCRKPRYKDTSKYCWNCGKEL